MAQLRGLNERDGMGALEDTALSGFGFGADGSRPDLVSFLSVSHRFAEMTEFEKQALAQFLFAFPTNYSPAVGTTVTVHVGNMDDEETKSSFESLIRAAENGHCDLVIDGRIADEAVRLRFLSEQSKFAATDGEDRITGNDLLKQMSTSVDVVTFIGVPVGNTQFERTRNTASSDSVSR
ncbi:MAG: hypothetical protein AAF456_24830 [Planctomycetota bacterium]